MQIFRLLIFSYAFLNSFLLIADPVHYDIGAIYKNRTLTLGLTGNLNHNNALWGVDNLLLKGSLESSVNIFTAGVVNTVEPSLQFFPVSVFGLGFGGYWNQSFTNSLDIKACGESIQCKGLVQWLYVNATVQAKIQRFMFRTLFKHGRLTQRDTSKPFFESSTVLVAPKEGSLFQSLNAVAAYEIDPMWQTGLYYLEARVLADHSRSEMGLLFVKYSPGQWEYFLGLGYFGSPVLKKARHEKDRELGPLALVTVSYKGVFCKMKERESEKM